MIYVLRQWNNGNVRGIVHHLERHGLPFRILEAYQYPEYPDLEPGDAIIALGGPASVTEMHRADYEDKFLLHEAIYLEEAGRLGIPCLAICLAHQLRARMELNPVSTGRLVLGVETVELTPAGMEHWLFQGMPQRLRVYQHHRDHVLTASKSAQVLAVSATCPVEAAAWDDHTVSTQFHPEILTHEIPDALKKYPDLLQKANLAVEDIVERIPPDYPMYTSRLFDNFLYRFGLIGRPEWIPRLTSFEQAA